MMMGDLVQGPRSRVAQHWAANQAYLALGNLLTSAALLGVDATPMEGFNPAEYDRILGLPGTGYATAVACALGYRSPQDKYAALAKVRFDPAELIQTI
jgi:nitroreductase